MPIERWPERDARLVGVACAVYQADGAITACRVGACVYVLGRYKAKASFVDTLRAMKQMVASGPTPHVVLVEDAASGPALLSMLHREIRDVSSGAERSLDTDEAVLGRAEEGAVKDKVETTRMRAYLLTTGSLFGLLGAVHIWRDIAERHHWSDPSYLIEAAVGVVALALCVWAFRLLRAQPE